MAKFLNYELMVQEALLGVVKTSLQAVLVSGLPGKHHFYITFLTEFPGAKIPDYLIEQFGDELTIVLQYEYWDLEVNDHGFGVTLCFDDTNEPLYIPYKAITNFVDPAVKFGLQFSAQLPDEDEPESENKVYHAQKSPSKVVTNLNLVENDDLNNEHNNVIKLDFTKKR